MFVWSAKSGDPTCISLSPRATYSGLPAQSVDQLSGYPLPPAVCAAPAPWQTKSRSPNRIRRSALALVQCLPLCANASRGSCQNSALWSTIYGGTGGPGLCGLGCSRRRILFTRRLKRSGRATAIEYITGARTPSAARYARTGGRATSLLRPAMSRY